MYISREFLLGRLPAYQNQWVTVASEQDVHDIIEEIEIAHVENAGFYDCIGPLFIGKSLLETCENLYFFCKENLKYVEESEALQTVSTPQGLLTAGRCDCKGYASFIGGCLGAIERVTGEKIDWRYCFASYKLFESSPYHVFIVVDTAKGPYYVDPTPGSAGKIPVWTVDREIKRNFPAAVNGLGELVGMGGVPASVGELIPAPAWYPAHLPKFYWRGADGLRLYPLNAVPGYTDADILDLLLYYQTIVGYNRGDVQNAKAAAWKNTSGWNSVIWAKAAFQTDAYGDGSGDWSRIPENGYSIDEAVYSAMQLRYIENEKARPWLKAMQAKGRGIDLMTIPMGTDIEQARPGWYPEYLPSLWKAGGLSYQRPAGSMDAKPKIRAEYDPTPSDVAALMLYAQPIVYAGPTPYPLNWFVNDNVNGAVSTRYKITLWFHQPFTNSQIQAYGISGDLMQQPDLSADPYASGFTHALQTVVSAAINFFAGKIPGGTKAIQAAYTAGNIGGGEMITGGPVPVGVFSAQVFQAADALNTKIDRTEKINIILLLALAGGAALGWYYWDDLKKYF